MRPVPQASSRTGPPTLRATRIKGQIARQPAIAGVVDRDDPRARPVSRVERCARQCVPHVDHQDVRAARHDEITQLAAVIGALVCDDRDDLETGRKKLRLEFELPKGAYATLVVKRVTDAA